MILVKIGIFTVMKRQLTLILFLVLLLYCHSNAHGQKHTFRVGLNVGEIYQTYIGVTKLSAQIANGLSLECKSPQNINRISGRLVNCKMAIIYNDYYGELYSETGFDIGIERLHISSKIPKLRYGIGIFYGSYTYKSRILAQASPICGTSIDYSPTYISPSFLIEYDFNIGQSFYLTPSANVMFRWNSGFERPNTTPLRISIKKDLTKVGL